jgi:hypothetical protein
MPIGILVSEMAKWQRPLQLDVLIEICSNTSSGNCSHITDDYQGIGGRNGGSRMHLFMQGPEGPGLINM